MKKLFLILLILSIGSLFLPVKKSSGIVEGISGDYRDGKTYWNRLSVSVLSGEIIETGLWFSYEDRALVEKKYRGQKIKIYKNIYGYWRTM